MQLGSAQQSFNKLGLGFIALFFLTLTLVGCGGGGGGNSPPAKTLTSIAITPTTASIASGLTAPFAAMGTYSDASTADITSQVTWTSANTGVATINSATGATSGIATGVALGSTTVVATLGSVTSPIANITVTAAVLTGINISATANAGNLTSITTLSIAKGLPVNFSAVGTYSDKNIVNITNTVTWVSSNAGTATLNSSGIASSLAQGVSTVTATLAGITSNAMTLTVTAPSLTSIAITPTTATVAKGTSNSFTATGSYTDNSTANITSTVVWSSSNSSVATINSATGATSGIATGVAVGSSSITASLSGITSSAASLTVTSAVMTAINVTPATASIAKGLPVTFTATASYSDGSSGNVSGSVVWASSNTAVATLSASGIASTLAQGATTVSASSNGVVSNGATLTVTPATLTAIAITPNAASVVKRSTLGFSATGTYTDATTANVSNQVTWSSSDTKVATISNAGVASGITTGSVVISASNLSGSTTINSNAVALVVTVAGIQLGGARQGVVPALAGSVTTLAGAGVPGNVNGTGSAVGFNAPRGITTDGLNLYIADSLNGLIRKINLNTGVVSSMSTGISTTWKPTAMTTDGTNLYIFLNGNVIQKIVIATGLSTTLAGQLQGAGCIDGMGIAVFGGGGGSLGGGITTDGTNLYVADPGCHAIRKVVIANGAVTTIAGTLTTTGRITGVAGNADNAVGTKATFNSPKGIATDGANLYVADAGNNTIRVVSIATTAVTTLAGSALTNGGVDGVGAAAGFNQPAGITTDGTYLYVADTSDHTIRKIEIATGTVTTIAGLALTSGNADGTGVLARFNSPAAITTDGLSLYVTDTNNHTIREVR